MGADFSRTKGPSEIVAVADPAHLDLVLIATVGGGGPLDQKLWMELEAFARFCRNGLALADVMRRRLALTEPNLATGPAGPLNADLGLPDGN